MTLAGEERIKMNSGRLIIIIVIVIVAVVALTVPIAVIYCLHRHTYSVPSYCSSLLSIHHLFNFHTSVKCHAWLVFAVGFEP